MVSFFCFLSLAALAMRKNDHLDNLSIFMEFGLLIMMIVMNNS